MFFLFVTDIILLVVTSIVLYIICTHAKLNSLVTSLASQQLREVDVVTKQEHVSVIHVIEYTFKIQLYTICILNISILGIVIFIILNARKLTLFREHLFSSTVEIMLFISDVLYYVPVKMCRTVEHIHLFKIKGKLIPEQIYYGIL